MENIKDFLIEKIQASGAHPFLFIGSGFSRRYMNTERWADLLKHFAFEFSGNRFLYSSYASQVDEQEYYGLQPKIAALLERDYNHAIFNDAKYRDFLEKHAESIDKHTSPLKLAISDYLSKATFDPDNQEIQTLKKLSIRSVAGIITTNYDTLLEQIFLGYKTYVGQEDLLFSNLVGVGEIYKIHGSITKPESLILTSKDYEQFEQLSSYLIAKILTIFLEYPVIFMGYSISDRNIQNILRQISFCLTQPKLNHLKDRLVFIDYNAQEKITERSFQFDNGHSISMTQISTQNFMQIYEAILSVKSRYNPKILRQLRRDIFDMVKIDTPSSKIVAIGFEQLDELSPDKQFVVGIGAANNGSLIKAAHLYEDDVLDNKFYDPRKVVDEYLPELLKSNSGGLPMHKYLKDYGRPVYGRVKEQLEKHKSIDSFLNTVLRKTKENYRKSMSELSVSNIIQHEGLQDAYKHLVFLEDDEIDPDSLKKYLRFMLTGNGNKKPEEVLKNNSELKRLIRIYDFVKYHNKMPLATSSNSENT